MENFPFVDAALLLPPPPTGVTLVAEADDVGNDEGIAPDASEDTDAIGRGKISGDCFGRSGKTRNCALKEIVKSKSVIELLFLTVVTRSCLPG
jgi:hypothetical protein